MKPESRRIVVLGTGTAVGKTFVSAAVLRTFAPFGQALGLKPIETGIEGAQTDQQILKQSGSVQVSAPDRALYAYPLPVSPHLACQAAGEAIELGRITAWVESFESGHQDAVVLIETAGGVCSPLSYREDNLDLAIELEPAQWLLVASNEIGVLHQVRCALQAMASRARHPDVIVLSQARPADAASNSNLAELQRLVKVPCLALGRHQDRAPELRALLQSQCRPALAGSAPR